MKQKTMKETKYAKISFIFTAASLIILAIPFGIIALIFGIKALVNNEKNATLAVILSILVPFLSWLVGMWFMLMVI